MALQKLQESKDVQVTPSPKVRNGDEASSQPKLKREVQSSKLLDPETPKTPVVSTAVKAKAAPPSQIKVEPAESTDRSRAVQDCLRRPSTTDMASPAASLPGGKIPEKEHKEAKKKDKDLPAGSQEALPLPPAPAPAPAQESDSESDSEEDRKKERLAKAKREAHARYMRFSRSLTSSLV